jgi:dihydrodipicolinate reductase
LLAFATKRRGGGYYSYEQLDSIKEPFDIIVDFSHKDSFDKVLEFALKTKKPLIIGTAELSEKQGEAIQKAACDTPIFRGGNFRFDVNNFIESVVDYARTHDDLELIETHYKTKKIPSQTAQEIKRRVFEATGKDLKITSRLEFDDLINDYRIGDLHCQVSGMEGVAKGILKIIPLLLNREPGIYDLPKLLVER